MGLFAIRQEVGTSHSKVVATTAGLAVAFHWRCAYWTPEDGLLFSVHEGAAPASVGDLPGVQPVIELQPKDYMRLIESPAAANRLAHQVDADLSLVLVRRHVQPASREEFDAMALRAVMCALEYSNLSWLHSFWAPAQQEVTCIFRTGSHDLVREHAERSRLPCDEVHDAVQLTSLDPARLDDSWETSRS